MREHDSNNFNERNEILGKILVEYREGDKETREKLQLQYERAINELTEKNKGLITQFLGNFPKAYREDIKQEGFLTLFLKIPCWDYRKGPLDNFVHNPVYHAMLREFKEHYSKGFSKIAPHFSRITKINAIQFELRDKLGRAPTFEEVVEKYNQSNGKKRIRTRVVEGLELVENGCCYLGSSNRESLEIADDNNSPLEEMIKQEKIDAIMEIVNNGVLNKREKKLIKDHYFKGRKLTEIADKEEVTKEVPSQIHRRAKRKIQEALKDKYPEIKVKPKYINKRALLLRKGDIVQC